MLEMLEIRIYRCLPTLDQKNSNQDFAHFAKPRPLPSAKWLPTCRADVTIEGNGNFDLIVQFPE